MLMPEVCTRVQTVFKAHEGAVHAMQLCQVSSGSATPGPLCLVTSGDPTAVFAGLQSGQSVRAHDHRQDSTALL